MVVRRTIHKAARVLKLVNAFGCFPTTVDRLPCNRSLHMLPLASREVIHLTQKGISLHGSSSVKEPVNGYTVNG